MFQFLLGGSKPDPPRPPKITKKYAFVLLKMTGLILAYSPSCILSKFGLLELYFLDFRFLPSAVISIFVRRERSACTFSNISSSIMGGYSLRNIGYVHYYF